MTDFAGTGSGELMPTVILAGGLATRLHPLTETIPKSLVEVAGHPFLWHQLQLLKRQGIHRVVLALGYLGEQIQDRYGDGSTLGMRIDYSFDGPVLLGTAGAIRKAIHLLPERFFVLYGDSYLTCNFSSVETSFGQSNLPGLMTVYRNDGMHDRSNVEYDGTKILRYNKRDLSPEMRYIDYGLVAFKRSVFADLPEDKSFDLATVLQRLLQEGNLAAFEVHERFYEIGSPAGLRDTERFLTSRT
jgi:MurNAc alpha-1-phosphate uridylyltransferase